MTANDQRETVPDRLRAMAESAAEQGNASYATSEEAATAFRVGLAQCVATLRMAAAAWPDERRPSARASFTRATRGDESEAVRRALSLSGVARDQAMADALDDMHETERRLGFEQGMQKCQEYTAAAEQDERDAAARRGESVPGTRETVKVANVAGVVAGHWRAQREHPQHQYEPVGPTLASLLDALLAEVGHALAATAPRD